MKPARLLLIGPLPRESDPIGGTQVSFRELVQNFRASGQFDISVVDTSRPHTYESGVRRRWSDLRALVRVVTAILAQGRESTWIMFNAAPGATLLAGPLITLLSHSLGARCSIRVFGGDLDTELNRVPGLLAWLNHQTTLSADLLLLQTDALCCHFADRPTVRQLPTTRRAPAQPRVPSPRCRRFLFLAQLHPEKGLHEAVQAAELLPDGCTLDVYGPRLPQTPLDIFDGVTRTRYLGEVAPCDVWNVHGQCDALIFPSWAHEGLPGVIIEALQCGLPVIASRWRLLPELIEDGVNGLLVEPRSASSLADAMRRLATNDTLYARLCHGARSIGLKYDSEVWHPQLEAWLLERRAA